ncbi:MAG: glucans biosynthesis glucosyltransferase MdoH [Sandaracinaceae bacterium]
MPDPTHPPPTPLHRRRLAMAALVAVTCAALTAAMAALFSPGGYRPTEVGMLVCFAATLPWQVLGFWNSVVGAGLLAFRTDPVRAVAPLAGLRDDDRASWAPRSRIALAMPIYHEDVERAFAHLRSTVASVDRAGLGDDVDVFVLSDSQRPGVYGAELAAFHRWRADDARPARLHYRRRPANTGFKAGNLRAFVEEHGDDFDLLVVLDADSLMSGRSIRRLVRLMEANPRLGILQSLAVGLPAETPFARVFQFGMRHGMRTYTTGSAFWQGDSGPYWGHNACLRIAPFRAHCALPELSGRGPLAGPVLSHDQVEAALMRGAGWEVRVLPEEGGSYEDNPPTLAEFVRRDLRWCQGNLQYLRLLGLPGLRPMGRLQLLLAILMYVGAPFWMGFVGLGFLHLALGPETSASTAVPFFGEVPPEAGLALFAAMMTIVFAPRLLGVLGTLLRPDARRAYGGTGPLLAGAALETLFSVLMGPLMAVAQTMFITGLVFGRTARWDGQARDGHTSRVADAVRSLWLPTLLGGAGTALLALLAPSVLPWALPVLGPWLLAVPFAVMTSRPEVGEALLRAGLCATPEERTPPVEVAEVSPAVRLGSQPRPAGARVSGEYPAMGGR